MVNPKRGKADAGLDTREVPLEAPAGTPSPLSDAYEAIARALFEAWEMRRNAPTSQLLFEQAARNLSQAWKVSEKKYEAVEILLQAEAQGRCAHREALNVIMRVNDACGHVMNGNVPFDQASNHLTAVRAFDITKLLKAMRRQTSRAALRVQKTDRDSPASDEKQILDKAKLSGHKKPSQNKGRHNARREARDKWIYDRCCDSILYKQVITELTAKSQKKHWRKIGTIQGIRSAAVSYAERHGLPNIPNRQDL